MEGNAEGFFGMLYIHETPLHFALSLTSVGMVITLIGGIINYRAKPPLPQS